ncbi:MAG TPA: hypothetical protein VHO67_04785 [Polyangia bacterium]|nr:hypothetical protein [Polyangia bacterium]
MHTVHARKPKTTKRAHTVHASRKKPRPIACSGCGGTTRCQCLSPHALGRELLQATRAFLASGTDLAKRRDARAALAEIVAREDQRILEEAALRAFCRAHTAPKGYSARRDRYAVWHLFGEFTGVVPYDTGRSVERTAELFRRPVAYMKDLRDRAMRAVQDAAMASSASGRRVA